MADLKQLPSASLFKHRRWSIRCVSDTMTVRSGVWTGDCYEYGLAAAGCAVEEVPAAFWNKTTTVVYILETADPGLFELTRIGKALTDATMLVGPEVFNAFGFEPPATDAMLKARQS